MHFFAILKTNDIVFFLLIMFKTFLFCNGNIYFSTQFLECVFLSGLEIFMFALLMCTNLLFCVHVDLCLFLSCLVKSNGQHKIYLIRSQMVRAGAHSVI